MLFTSYGFIAFMAAVLVLYYLLPKVCQWPLLLVASLAFYAIADWRYLFFIVFTAASAYLIALKLESIEARRKAILAQSPDMSKEEKKALKARHKAAQWRWLLLALFLELGVLAVTKYTNFVLENLGKLFRDGRFHAIDMIVPMGISFYTFQTVSYVIDVYRGKQTAQRNFLKLLLFVSFFPQLVQGPISRYGDLSKTLYGPHPYDGKAVSFGLTRVLWGYFKKVVLADRIITAVTALIADTAQYTGTYVFVAMLFYAFELYCDFTGGIDITIGLAEAMGIKVAENFNLPYFSKNIKEYWNRWHITMGTWFTDYIFYPISVSKPMLKLSKWSRDHLGKAVGKRVTVYLSCFAVWLATGIWHGAAWNFVVWGLMNFVVIMASQELEPLYARFHARFHVKGKAPYEVFQIVRTILLMSVIRMFDCYRDVPMTFKMVGTMFTRFNIHVLWDGSLLALGLTGADYGVLIIGFFIVLGVSLYKARRGSVREALYRKPRAALYGVMAALALVIVIFGAYGVGYDSSQFIYNQF